MAYTKEEYRQIGEGFTSHNVIEQVRLFVRLGQRDAAGLARFGWPAANIEALAALGAELAAAVAAYEARFGTHMGQRRTTLEQMDLAKRWRLRVLAIGRNVLDGADVLARLERIGARAGLDPAKLATQVEGYLGLARETEASYRAGGADDAFFAEGERLLRVLRDAATTRAHRGKDLPAEHDRVDELDGQCWDRCKRMSRSGKALHLAAGDRGRAAEYKLDLLYGYRRVVMPVEPEPGSGPEAPIPGTVVPPAVPVTPDPTPM